MDYKPLHFYRFPCGCEGICLGPANDLPGTQTPCQRALVFDDCQGGVSAEMKFPNNEGFGREAEELDPTETADRWARSLRGRLDAADIGERLASSLRDAMTLLTGEKPHG